MKTASQQHKAVLMLALMVLQIARVTHLHLTQAVQRKFKLAVGSWGLYQILYVTTIQQNPLCLIAIPITKKNKRRFRRNR